MVNTQFFTFLFVRKMERKETFGDNMTSSTHPGLISDVPDVGLLEINDMKDKSVSQKDEKETKKSSVASKSRRAPGKISRYLENKDNVKRNEPDPTGTSQNPSKKNNNDRLGIPRNSAKNSKPDPIGTPRSRSRKHPDAIRTPQNTVNNNQSDGTPHNDNGAANSNQPDLIGAQGRIANSNQFDPAGTPHNITQNKCFDGIGTASNTSKNVQFDPTGTPTNSASMRNSQPDAIGAPRIAAKFNHPEPIGTPHRTGKKNQPDPIGTPRRKNYNDSKRNRASHEREREKRQSNSENTVGVEEGKVPTIIKQKVTDKTHTNSDPVGIPSNNNQMCDLSQSLLEDQTLQSTFEEGSSLEVSFDQPSLEGEGDGKQTGDGLTKGDSEAHGLLIDNQPVYTPEEEELKAKGIFKLHKKKLKFPRAKYFCRLCNYHMDSVKECQDHVSQTRHNRLMKNKIAAEHFQELPKLSSSHVKALSSTLEEIVKDVGLTDEMMAERQVVADRVNSIIGKVMPDCQVDMYGSSVSGFGFKTSGINLNIKTTGKKTPAELLLEALEVISREKKHFKSVEAKFEEKFPVISFIDKASNHSCELGTSSDFAVATSHLLLLYRNSDPRVRTLGIAFRYWAHLLEIDRPWDGSIPAYVYVLMLIFFLQRCLPPVLPVIQQGEQLTEKNQLSIGELWVKLFHFYLVEINIEEEIVCIRTRHQLSRKTFHFLNRRIVIDDPCAQDKRAITKYVSSAEIFSFIMDGFHIALEYFSSSNGLGNKDLTSILLEPKLLVESSSSSDDRKNSCEDSSPIAESTHVERTSEDLSEDSIAKCDSHLGDDIKEADTALNNNQEDFETDANTAHINLNAAPSSDQLDGETSRNTVLTDDSSAVVGDLAHSVGGEVRTDTYITKESKVNLSSDGSGADEADGFCLSKLSFVFDKDRLTGGQHVPKICSNCQQEGHLSKDCEDDKLPDMVALPPMERSYLNKIQQLCHFVSDHFSSTKYELQERNFIIRDLEFFIQNYSGADIQLALFGSSVNGFGFQNSDLDICMTFGGDPTGQGINVPEVIQSLASILRKHPDLYNVIPITTAKVPIVKFMHRHYQLEGDISLYNLLAQHNTRLLKTYSEIDRRVCRLGHMVKAFAKECDIADASRGSLSSYAYILLTLYFLQQTSPPVIPVLQELHKPGKKPERLVEGRNTWFFENIGKLIFPPAEHGRKTMTPVCENASPLSETKGKITSSSHSNIIRVILPGVRTISTKRTTWNGFGRNSLSEAELWLEFLKFYTERFDFSKYVVCIRQYKKLTRFEKMWMGKGFAIEDPFDLDHNLGGALSRRMANYITLIFRKGRERFGTPQSVPRQMYKFFLDYDFLSDGQLPPNDRGCRICGKIGHYVKDCPVKLRSKEKKRAKAAAGQKKVSQDSTETTNSQGSTPISRTQSTPSTSAQDSQVSGETKSTKKSVNQPPSKSRQRTEQSNTSLSNSKVGSSKERQRNTANGGETTREVESARPKLPLASQTPSRDEMSQPISAMTPSEPIMTPSQPALAPQQQIVMSPSRPAMTPDKQPAMSPSQPAMISQPQPAMSPSRPAVTPQQQPTMSPSRPPVTPPSPLSPSVMSGLQGSPTNFAGSPPLPLLQFGMGSPTRTSSPGPMSPSMYSPLPVPGSPFSGTILFPRSPVPYASQAYQMAMRSPPVYMMQNPNLYQPHHASPSPSAGSVPLMNQRTPSNLMKENVPLAQATAELQHLLGVLPSLTNAQPQPKMETPFDATSPQEGPS